MTRRALLVVLLAACSGPSRAPVVHAESGTRTGESDEVRRKRLVAELEDEILASYERDDLPDLDTEMIPQQVGPARIGVGPGDVLVGDEVRQRASSRWPLFLGPGVPTVVRSKRLDVHLSHDHQVSAAWMSDELSWRITVCGHVAVIPLRITALYAHDGDRWVEVFEHLSWGRVPTPYFTYEADDRPTNVLHGAAIPSAVVDKKLAEELSHVLEAVMSRQPQRVAAVVATDPRRVAEGDPSQPAPTFLLAPDPEGEWHGDMDPAAVELVDGTLEPEGVRVGTVGPSVGESTVAYWVGNFIANLAARPGIAAGTKVRLRGTFVFENRGGRWVLVQGHLSEPIDDFELAEEVFGSTLDMSEQDMLRKQPLQVNCDDGSR